jgi:hypothetical protein
MGYSDLLVLAGLGKLSTMTLNPKKIKHQLSLCQTMNLLPRRLV